MDNGARINICLKHSASCNKTSDTIIVIFLCFRLITKAQCKKSEKEELVDEEIKEVGERGVKGETAVI